MSAHFDARNIIETKSYGGEHHPQDIRLLVNAMQNGTMRESQITAWLEAVSRNGLSDDETTALAIAMVYTGNRLHHTVTDTFVDYGPTVDVHSTGAIGGKLPLIVMPLLAVAGCYCLKLGGHDTSILGGLFEKLATIPRFRCEDSLENLATQTKRLGLAFGLHTNLAPVYRRLSPRMRRVAMTPKTASLYAASIMATRLAAGSRHIVLDVTCGRGAYISDFECAKKIARQAVTIGAECGRNVIAFVTNADFPFGHMIGGGLEIREVIQILSGQGSIPLRELALDVATAALVATKRRKETASELRAELAGYLDTGQARLKFQNLIEAQGGDPRLVGDPSMFIDRWMMAGFSSAKEGWITDIDARDIGTMVQTLRGKDGKADSGLGVEVLVDIGCRVEVDQAVIRVYHRQPSILSQLEDSLSAFGLSAFGLSEEPITPPALILARFGQD